MSERRPHWTDDLIEEVYAELPAKKYQVEPDSWEVHRIIAAVGDWQGQSPPRRSGEFLILGPRCFADEMLTVINYEGRNFYADESGHQMMNPGRLGYSE